MNIRPEDPPPVRKAFERLHRAQSGEIHKRREELKAARLHQLAQELGRQNQERT